GVFDSWTPQLAQKLFPLRFALPQAAHICRPAFSDSGFTFTDSSTLCSRAYRCMAWSTAALDLVTCLASSMRYPSPVSLFLRRTRGLANFAPGPRQPAFWLILVQNFPSGWKTPPWPLIPLVRRCTAPDDSARSARHQGWSGPHWVRRFPESEHCGLGHPSQ